MTMSDSRRETLRLFCDTVVPRIERDPDPGGFWARSASELGVPQGVEQLLATLDAELHAGLMELLDAIDSQGLARMPSPELPRAGASQHLARLARGRRRDPGAHRHDALPRLRNAGPADRPQSELGGLRLPRARPWPRGRCRSRSSRSCPRTARRSRRTWWWSAPGRAARRRGDAGAGRQEGVRPRGRRATSTSPTSSGSSCRPTRRCTGAADRLRPPTATSRSRRARRSAAGR